MVIVLKSMDSNKKLFKKLRAQIANMLRNYRTDTKYGVSYKKRVMNSKCPFWKDIHYIKLFAQYPNKSQW